MITIAIIYLSMSFITMAICYATTKPVKTREEIFKSYLNNKEVIDAINALGKAGIKSAEAFRKFGESFKQLDHE